MNKIVYNLLLKLEQCDDKHNRCDYLMEHDEITYLLEHIEEKDKQLDKYKNVIDKIKEIANKTDYDKWELQMTSIEKLMKIQKILEEVDE